MTTAAPNPIRSLAKVLLVLECFSGDERWLGLAEIANRTGLPRATTHRLLAALMAIGCIEQPHGGDHHRLGMKLFELGSVVLANMELPREAQPFVDRLAALTGATVHLCVFDGAQAVLIDRRTDDTQTRNTLTLLEGAPVHCTSMGKAMLAWQPERVVDRIIRAGRTGALGSKKCHTIWHSCRHGRRRPLRTRDSRQARLSSSPISWSVVRIRQ